MQNTIEITCPQEILPGLHLDANRLAGKSGVGGRAAGDVVK